MVSDEVIEKIEDDDFAIYVVWTPVLGTDDRASTADASDSVPDDRATHYWDGATALGELYGEAVELPRGRSLAWDIYFVFDRDAEWQRDVPAPASWMHQLGRDERLLDGDALREAVRDLLKKTD